MKTIENIRLALGYKNYFWFFVLFSVLFWLLFGFLLGLENLPWLDLNALSNSVVWELFLPNLVFGLAAGALNALLLTLTVFRLKESRGKIGGKESKAGLLGVGLTSVFVSCPVCGAFLPGVVGISFAASFIAPYFVQLQLFSLLVVLVAIHWTANKIGAECKSCKIRRLH